MAVGGLTEEGGREGSRGKRGREEGGARTYLQQMRGAIITIIRVLLQLVSVRSCDSHMSVT